ncbi:uncharacterized protein LOC134193438 [Corticium candelabrum]|uniref:uncharacterized protein LOC134193438 n=1 Tax=Corticium candelabrum TaxID=121492 RepID=UPI002E25C9B9|nr:uncharacterized protein LOC134193438 [Corticium candelabrum]
MVDHDYNLLLGKENSDKVSARLRSVSGKGAGAFLEAILTANKLALKPGKFYLTACLHLALHLPFQGIQDKCDYGTHLNSFGYHLLTCKHRGGPIWAHDLIVSSWSECLKELAVLHNKEPKIDICTMRIVSCDTSILSDQKMDISLAYPWSEEVVRTCTKLREFAAKKREEMKSGKYDIEILPGGSHQNACL